MINQAILYAVVIASIGIVLGIYFVNIKKFTKREQIVYLYLISSFSLWVLFNTIADLVPVYDIAFFAARISILFSVHVSVAVLLLSSVFPEFGYHRESIEKKKKKITLENTVVVISLFITVFLIATLNTPLNISSFTVGGESPASFEPGVLYILVFGYSLIVFSFAFVRWFSRFYEYTRLQQEQIKLLSASLILTILALVIGFIVLPLPSIDLSPYSILAHLVIAFFLLQYQWNILQRESVVSVKVMIQKIVVYFILTGIGLFTYKAFVVLDSNGASIFSLFLIIPLLLLGGGRIKQFLEEKIISKGYEVDVNNFQLQTTFEYKTKGVIRRVVKLLKKMFSGSNISFYLLPNPHVSDLVEIGLFDYLNHTGENIVTAEKLIRDINNSRLNKKLFIEKTQLLEYFLKKEILILSPIFYERELKALLIVEGGLLPDSMVIVQLKELLQITTIALTRAMLYEEVESFADSLKRTVDQRTGELKDSKVSLEKKNVQLSKAFAKLKTLDKAKSEFISMASHQLRTPISIVFGYLSMLYDGDIEGKLEEKQLEILKRALVNIKQLNNVVEDILNTSRIEQGRLSINYENTEIRSMVLSIIEELSSKAEARGLKFISDIPDKPLIVEVDKVKIHEVFINIIDNAIVYTPKGKIKLTLQYKKKDIFIKVEDTGIGIPKKSQHELFKRFSRLDNAKKVRPDGSGIGLFTAKTIVEMHGGKIWFDSELNKGTVFFISLPMKKEGLGDFRVV